MQEAARHALAMAEQHRMQASGSYPPQDGETILPVPSAICNAILPVCASMYPPWLHIGVLHFSKHLLSECRTLTRVQHVQMCHCSCSWASCHCGCRGKAGSNVYGRARAAHRAHGSWAAAGNVADAVIRAGGRCGGQGACPGARQASGPLPYDSSGERVSHGGATFHG